MARVSILFPHFCFLFYWVFDGFCLFVYLFSTSKVEAVQLVSGPFSPIPDKVLREVTGKTTVAIELLNNKLLADNYFH